MWACMEPNPRSSELMIKASTCIATMAQKPLATVVLNRKADWYNRFSVCQTLHLKSTTSGIRKVLSSFPTVWASAGVFLVFIQAGFAVYPPTARQLVGSMGCIKADLTHQFVWWCIRKRAVIPFGLRRTSHRSQQHVWRSGQ